MSWGEGRPTAWKVILNFPNLKITFLNTFRIFPNLKAEVELLKKKTSNFWRLKPNWEVFEMFFFSNLTARVELLEKHRIFEDTYSWGFFEMSFPTLEAEVLELWKNSEFLKSGKFMKKVWNSDVPISPKRWHNVSTFSWIYKRFSLQYGQGLGVGLLSNSLVVFSFVSFVTFVAIVEFVSDVTYIHIISALTESSSGLRFRFLVGWCGAVTVHIRFWL